MNWYKVQKVNDFERFFKTVLFVAIDQTTRQCVGYCTFRMNRNRVGLTDVYVQPKHRRHGVGRRLKMTAIDYGFYVAKAKSFATAVYRANEASIANLESQGYRRNDVKSDRRAWRYELRRSWFEKVRGK